MPVLVESDATKALTISTNLPPGSQTLPRIDELDGYLAARHDEYAIILGPSVPMAQAMALAERLRLDRPSTSVLLVRKMLATDIFAPAMHSGISAVVALADLPGLNRSLDTARQTWEAITGTRLDDSDRNGRVITVFSPKGGVGKTTLAVNLGLVLSHSGRTVCVVDLDLTFGDVAITLQMVPEHTIAEAAGTEQTLDFTMLQKLLTTRGHTLSILAAPTHPEARDALAPALVRRVIATLRHHFDFVIIDTPPGFDEHTLQAFDETDECILIATLDVPTIKNMKMALETFDVLDMVPSNRHLVLNRADDEVGLTSTDVEGILRMPVACALPNSLAVATSTNQGEPIVIARPDHPVSRAIVALAQRVAGTSDDAFVQSPVPVARRRFFGRRKQVS